MASRPLRHFLATFAVKISCAYLGKIKRLNRKERKELPQSSQREPKLRRCHGAAKCEADTKHIK
jgi:hypothetical protein